MTPYFKIKKMGNNFSKKKQTRFSHIRERSSQYSNTHTEYKLNCLVTFWTQLTCHFNGQTTQLLKHTTVSSGEEPTSRCQTFLSMWTLGEDQPVIPKVTFIRWTTTLPLCTVGSLMGLAVKLLSAFALSDLPLVIIFNWIK